MHSERVRVPQSIRSGRLILERRFLLDDCFASFAIGVIPTAIFIIDVLKGRFSIVLALVGILAISLSALALLSVEASYKLIEIPGSPSKQANRVATAAAFDALGWRIFRNNKHQVSAHSYTNWWQPGRIIIVLPENNRVWFSARADTRPKAGRLPFQGRRLRAAYASFRQQFELQLGERVGWDECAKAEED